MSTGRDRVLSYLCPLMDKLIFKKGHLVNQPQTNCSRTGLRLSSRQQNGPFMVIVCTSCERAQHLYEQVTAIIERVHSMTSTLRLKALMIQGVGKDDQFQVPLMNGIDVLIASTPFVLDRMLGLGWTNLERMHTLVFENGYLLLEKYAEQVRQFQRSYHHLLQNNDDIYLAQIVVVTPNWSDRLAKFVESMLIMPVVLCESKLEAAFYGKVNHFIIECESTHQKARKIRILSCLCLIRFFLT